MVLGGTPMTMEVNLDKTQYTIPAAQYGQFLTKLKRKQGEEEVMRFAKLYRQNIILTLQLLPASKLTPGVNSGMAKSLRQEIIDSISEVRFSNSPEGFKATIDISHPLALALDEGTGIYGPNGTPIVPTSRKYMFIPGDEFAKSYHLRKFSAMGYDAAQAKQAYHGLVTARRGSQARQNRKTAVAGARSALGGI